MDTRVTRVGWIGWSRQGFALLIGLWMMASMFGRMGQVDVQAIAGALRDINALNWLLASAATAISLAAVSRYDSVIIGLAGLDIARPLTTRTGFSATAIAQSAGFGLLTGGFIRWRLYRDHGVSFWRAVQLTGLIALGFLSALAVVASAAVLLAGIAPHYNVAASGVLAGFTGLLLLALFRPTRLAQKLPPLPAIGTLLWLTLIDTGTAAAALWLFLPAGAGISFGELYAIYLLALGAALVFGTPMGFGPFELTLLALLPHLEMEPLLASIAAFRVVYYILPLPVAAVVLLRPARIDRARARTILKAPGHPRPLWGAQEALITQSHRADANLLRQGDKDLHLTPTGRNGLMARASGNSLVALSDPLGPIDGWPEALQTLAQTAKEHQLFPCLYKSGPILARIARNQGWVASRIGAEAILNPQDFTTEGRDMRELRRKLRQANKAGTTITRTPCMDDLARISHRWSANHQGERGFSMGRFDPEYLQGQQIYAAYDGDNCVGFLSLFKTANETSIDLLRVDHAATSGVAHLLVFTALLDAQKQGHTRFSLCAAPFFLTSAPETLFERMLLKTANRIGAENGLFRFKNSFRPEWEDQFLISGNMAMQCAVVPDIARLIHKT